MANDISSNPWFIDTAGVLYKDKVKIKRLVWTQQATAGDSLVLKDINGQIIIQSKAYQPNFNQEFAYDGWFNGLDLTTLTSGVLLVYLAF